VLIRHLEHDGLGVIFVKYLYISSCTRACALTNMCVCEGGEEKIHHRHVEIILKCSCEIFSLPCMCVCVRVRACRYAEEDSNDYCACTCSELNGCSHVSVKCDLESSGFEFSCFSYVHVYGIVFVFLHFFFFFKLTRAEWPTQ
jgi:hypothetical protein